MTRDEIIISIRVMRTHPCFKSLKGYSKNSALISGYARLALEELMAIMLTTKNDAEEELIHFLDKMEDFAQHYEYTHYKNDVNYYKVAHDTALQLYRRLSSDESPKYHQFGYGYDKMIT